MNSTVRADFPSSYGSRSPEDTLRIGELIGRKLAPGTVLALRGGLGAGKTQLTKGIARGLGITDEITSPTYTIVSEYQGSMPGGAPLFHIDAYRLRGDEDFENIGGREFYEKGGICVIEWSERILSSLPKDALVIEIEISGPTERRICFR